MYQFPPRKTASIAGERIEYVVAGSGPANVVLVNGASGPIEGWFRVFEPLTQFATVFAYNRAGIGGSSRAGQPQTTRHMAASLKAALAAAGLSGPHVLVGHSLGGLIVNLFARLHPADTAAVVFVEASSPKDVLVLRQHENWIQCSLGTLTRAIAPPHPFAETEHIQASVGELEAAPSFPAIPVTVIAGARPAMAWATPKEALALRAEHQKELAKLSPLGKYVSAPRSGHFPQLTEPELVIDEIRSAVQSPVSRKP